VAQERLDRRSRLLVLRCRAVQKPAAVIVAAAADGDDRAVLVVHAHHGDLHQIVCEADVDVAALDAVHSCLHIRFHVGFNIHAVHGRILAGHLLGFRDDGIDVGIVLGAGCSAAVFTDQLVFHFDGFCQVAFFLRDVAVVAHHVQNVVASGRCVIQIVVGVVFVRQIDDARQHGAFRQIQFTDGFAEIVHGGFLDAADIAAEVQLVHIKLEDRLLVQLLFQLDGQIDLLNLVFNGLRAFNGLIALVDGKVGVLDQLHREGGAALAEVPVLQVFDDGFGETRNVKSEMLEITGVLYGDEGVHEAFRTLVIGDVLTQVGAEFRNHVAFGIIDLGRFLTDEVGYVQSRGVRHHFLHHDDAGCRNDDIDADNDNQDGRPDGQPLLLPAVLQHLRRFLFLLFRRGMDDVIDFGGIFQILRFLIRRMRGCARDRMNLAVHQGAVGRRGGLCTARTGIRTRRRFLRSCILRRQNVQRFLAGVVIRGDFLRCGGIRPESGIRAGTVCRCTVFG